AAAVAHGVRRVLIHRSRRVEDDQDVRRQLRRRLRGGAALLAAALSCQTALAAAGAAEVADAGRDDLVAGAARSAHGFTWGEPTGAHEHGRTHECQTNDVR